MKKKKKASCKRKWLYNYESNKLKEFLNSSSVSGKEKLLPQQDGAFTLFQTARCLVNSFVRNSLLSFQHIDEPYILWYLSSSLLVLERLHSVRVCVCVSFFDFVFNTRHPTSSEHPKSTWIDFNGMVMPPKRYRSRFWPPWPFSVSTGPASNTESRSLFCSSSTKASAGTGSCRILLPETFCSSNMATGVLGRSRNQKERTTQSPNCWQSCLQNNRTIY